MPYAIRDPRDPKGMALVNACVFIWAELKLLVYVDNELILKFDCRYGFCTTSEGIDGCGSYLLLLDLDNDFSEE